MQQPSFSNGQTGVHLARRPRTSKPRSSRVCWSPFCSPVSDGGLRKKGSSRTKNRKRALSATSIASTQPASKKARVEETEDDDAAMSTAVTDPGPGALGLSSRTKAKVNIIVN